MFPRTIPSIVTAIMPTRRAKRGKNSLARWIILHKGTQNELIRAETHSFLRIKHNAAATNIVGEPWISLLTLWVWLIYRARALTVGCDKTSTFWYSHISINEVQNDFHTPRKQQRQAEAESTLFVSRYPWFQTTWQQKSKPQIRK